MSTATGQRGAALVELIVAMTISSLVMGGLVAAIYIVIGTTERGNAAISAANDLRMAGYWIGADARRAGDVSLVDGGPALDSVTLEWSDSWGRSHSSSYALVGTALERTSEGVTKTIAWHVTSVQFSLSGAVLTYEIESMPEGRWRVSRAAMGTAFLRPS